MPARPVCARALVDANDAQRRIAGNSGVRREGVNMGGGSGLRGAWPSVTLAPIIVNELFSEVVHAII